MGIGKKSGEPKSNGQSATCALEEPSTQGTGKRMLLTVAPLRYPTLQRVTRRRSRTKRK